MRAIYNLVIEFIGTRGREEATTDANFSIRNFDQSLLLLHIRALDRIDRGSK